MAWRLSAGYGRRQSNADGLTRGTGPEVGGPAHGGPLLGFRGAGPGGRLGGFERTGAEQQAQRWLVEAGDPDDQCGSADRVPGLPAVGRSSVADHPTNGQVVVRTDRHGPRRRATPIGAEGAGLDDGDVDAERFDFVVEDLREAFAGELRGLVGAQPWRPADASTDGRELDEVTRALLAQHRQCRLRDVDDPEQIRLDLRAEDIVRHIFDRRKDGVAGVVDDDIEAAKRVDRQLDGRLRRLGVGYVEGTGAHALTVAPDEIVELLGPARGRHHVVAVLEDSLGEFPSETAGASRYQPRLCHEI